MPFSKRVSKRIRRVAETVGVCRSELRIQACAEASGHVAAAVADGERTDVDDTGDFEGLRIQDDIGEHEIAVADHLTNAAEARPLGGRAPLHVFGAISGCSSPASTPS